MGQNTRARPDRQSTLRGAFELLNAPPEPDNGTKEMPTSRGDIRFEQVRLQASASGQPAAACTLPAGATVTPGGAVVRLRSAGGVSSGFQQACEGHSGYFAINLKLSGDGGCLEMCCTGDSSSGYTCLSDPNAIRRVSALWVGPQLSIITASKEGAIAPAPAGVVITVTVAPEAEK